MKIAITYYTKFGNNEELADFLADQFKLADVSVYSTKKHSPKHVVHSDLYIISAPTHIGNAPFRIRRFLKKTVFPKKFRYALVNTRAKGGKTLETMDNILSGKGGSKIGELKIEVKDKKGPMEDNWQRKVKEFSKSLTIQ